jgi:signal transduction histidine kinase
MVPKTKSIRRKTGSDPQALTDSFAAALAPAVLVVDDLGQCVACSPSASRLLSVDPGALETLETGKRLAALLRLGQKAIQSRQPAASARLKVPRPDGVALFVRASGFPLPSRDGTRLAAVEFQDLSAMDPLLERARRLERLASIGTLSAGVAHEIKNSLVAIKSFAELLLEKRQDIEMATLVREEVNRIDSLINQVLRLANPAKQAFARITVHDLILASLRLVQPQLRARRLEQVLTLDARIDVVHGDARQLQQAFLNLLMNAIEAMGEQGTLIVRSHLVTLGERLARTRDGRPRRHLEIAIQDNGPGIPPEHLDRLFTAFFTTKPGGTGLGLTITRGIIHDHGGRITVESKSRLGTTVRIALPLAE